MRFEDARLERAITEWRAAARAATRAMLDNYCFEERASDKRREAFEQYALTAGALEELLRAHSNYWSDFVRVDQDIPHTFASEFKPADLGALDPAQWIVRVESLLRPLNKFGITFDELNAAFIGNQTDFLDNFLRTWNNSNIRDWRPTFAVFYDEVADDCDIDEWPHRLRDRLGLAHYSGPDRTPIALMKYTAQDVADAAKASKSVCSFTVPTVFDSSPWPFFFPAPHELSAGRAMPLFEVDDDKHLLAEILHFRVEYKRAHITKLGQIQLPPNPYSVAGLRNHHLLALRLAADRYNFGQEIPE